MIKRTGPVKSLLSILLTVMMITSCSVSEKNGADGRGSAISTEAETGLAGTSGREEVTEAGSAAEAERNKTAAIPDGIKTLVSASADYTYGKHPMPENTLPPLKTDFINSEAEPVKYLDYNGTAIRLNYERSLKSVYSEFGEDVYCREGVQTDVKRVMFFENGEVSAITDDFLGSLSVDDLDDTEKVKNELINIFSGIAPYFDRYDSFSAEKIGFETRYTWYNDINGAVSYDSITIAVGSKGDIRRFRRSVMPEEVLKYKPDITEEQIRLIAKQERDRILETAGMTPVPVNREEFSLTGLTYVSYEGKPAFECSLGFYGHDPNGDEVNFEGFDATLLIFPKENGDVLYQDEPCY